MQPSATELEQIVRVVMQRLAAGRDLMAGVAEMAEPVTEPTELTISDRVVTTHVIEGRLDGKRTLRVGARAIVTPAVADLLRAKKIELIKGSQSGTSPAASSRASARTSPSQLQLQSNKAQTSKAASPGAAGVSTHASVTDGIQRSPNATITASNAPILVCGSAVWFNSLNRHLCPKQAIVQAGDDAAALQMVERHLAQGGRRAVWLSSTPFAAAANAQRNSSAVTVQLPSLAELPAALEQAQPKVLVVDAPRWTVAAIGNLVRSLARIQ